MRVIILWTWHFGHALADIVRKNGHEVIAWSFREQKPLDTLPQGDIYISTLNAMGVEAIGKQIATIANGAPIVSATKAFILGSDMEQIFPSRVLGNSSLVFSWPNLASEMLRWLPTGATIAGKRALFEQVQPIFAMPTFFVEHHEDKTVVELMGIMKNIIAIGIGMIDGLALGENLKWIFIARMCRDIAVFSEKILGETFDITRLYAGIGDLFTTCSSSESRNHSFWVYFARTRSIQVAVDFMNTSIEWLHSIHVLQNFPLSEFTFLSAFLRFFHDIEISEQNFVQIFLQNDI